MNDWQPYWILDETGEPQPIADVLAWSYWFERSTRDRSRILAQDKDERHDCEVLVSTVFLGFDHSFTDGPPVLWETMILGGPLDGYQRRYATRAEALIGHAAACVVQKRSQKLPKKVAQRRKSFRTSS